MQKAKIKDWYIVGDVYMVGTIVEHPNFKEGTEVTTSTIRRIDLENNIVETRNTVYMLIGKGLKNEHKEC